MYLLKSMSYSPYEFYHLLSVFYARRFYAAAHIYGVGMKLGCRRGVARVQPAGQKIRPVQRRSQRPVEGLSRAAGSMVQEDEVC